MSSSLALDEKIFQNYQFAVSSAGEYIGEATFEGILSRKFPELTRASTRSRLRELQSTGIIPLRGQPLYDRVHIKDHESLGTFLERRFTDLALGPNGQFLGMDVFKRNLMRCLVGGGGTSAKKMRRAELAMAKALRNHPKNALPQHPPSTAEPSRPANPVRLGPAVQSAASTKTALRSIDERLSLLNFKDSGCKTTETEKAVLVSDAVLNSDPSMLPQHGLLGRISSSKNDSDADKQIFVNTNYPNSYFICGVQGSGKSHTTSCLLENHLLRSTALGKLESPCSAMVFNYSQTCRNAFQPCEAVYLAMKNASAPFATPVQKVRVLVSESNFASMKRGYSKIPGVQVVPLKFYVQELNIAFIMKLMAVDTSSNSSLYMSQVKKVLRDMSLRTGGSFDYRMFKADLSSINFSPDQKRFLDMRMDLMESFLDLTGKSSCFNFEPGSLTIIDLSCPFVDADTACVLFNICVGFYLEDDKSKGKIITVDEAHRYMTETTGAKELTNTLLSVIRQQRHYGTRVVVSTQEPTIDPRLLDLSSAVIIHRFSSVDWFRTLRAHIQLEENNEERNNLFQDITALGVGEAVIFAPSAMINVENDAPEKLGRLFVTVQVRKRVTWDGGRSILAVS